MTTKNGEENIVDQKKYELLLSLKERNIRMKQKLLWEENKQLLSEDKLYYTSKEKELIKQLLYNPIPPEYRKEYWFIITGAKLEYKNNPGYYQSLQKLLANNTNFPFIKTITLDMHRTFPHMETFKKEENLTKLSNILKAFALRNCSSIAYCQGFNYIAAQLLLVMEDEEKVFWTFTKIIEDYLPFDFYLKFTGVRADMAIMHSILVKKLDYIDKNEELNLCINNLVSRCFISLYSEIVEIEILRNIWDIFFVYGNVILFRTFNFIASLLFDKKFKKYNIETVHEELTQKLHQIKGNDLLNYFLLIERNINSSFIEANRRIKRHQVYKQNSQFVETVGDPSNKCDLNSPYCYFNNIINDINKFSEYKIFRLKKNTKKFENYFLDKFKEENFNNKNNENTIKNEICIDSFDDILIERMEHVCNKEKDENIETKNE
jgi:hypothetical protein